MEHLDLTYNIIYMKPSMMRYNFKRQFKIFYTSTAFSIIINISMYLCTHVYVCIRYWVTRLHNHVCEIEVTLCDLLRQRAQPRVSCVWCISPGSILYYKQAGHMALGGVSGRGFPKDIIKTTPPNQQPEQIFSIASRKPSLEQQDICQAKRSPTVPSGIFL